MRVWSDVAVCTVAAKALVMRWQVTVWRCEVAHGMELRCVSPALKHGVAVGSVPRTQRLQTAARMLEAGGRCRVHSPLWSPRQSAHLQPAAWGVRQRMGAGS